MFLIIGLLQIVWMNFHGLVAKGHFPQGFAEFSQAEKLGMNYGGEEFGGWRTYTGSRRFVRGRQ